MPHLAATVTFTAVNGAPPGGQASATVQTSANVACTLTYVTPSGTTSSAQGLGAATADASGLASWSWSIAPSTKTGTGSVTATCGGVSATAAVTIG